MIKNILIPLFAAITLASCAEMQTKSFISKKTIRTIILDGETYTEGSPGDFKTLRCNDFINGGKTLIEVGQISASSVPSLGFILFEGSNEGTAAYYSRRGLNRVWSWGPNEEYRITVYPDEKGAYFDFTGTPDGETITSKGIYKCN